MPAHASQDSGPSDGPAGPLTRRRFPTYVVAAPVLTVAAGSVIAPGKAYAVVPSPPQPENILDLGDVMVAATKQAEDLLVLEVTTDNRVVFRVPRAEVGQGITTALAMVVADEIDARLVDVDVPLEEARQDLGTAQSTGGSSSVRALWDPGALDCGGSPRPARYRGGAAHVLPDPQGDQARRGHDVKSASRALQSWLQHSVPDKTHEKRCECGTLVA